MDNRKKQERDLQDQYFGKCRTGKCRTGFWRTFLQEQWHRLQWSSVAQCNTAFCVKCSSWLLMLSRCFSQRNWMSCSFWASGARVFCFIISATVVLQFPPARFLVLLFRSCIFSRPEKSRSDCGELAEVAGKRRATCDSNGLSLDCSLQYWSSDWCAAGTRKALYFASSSLIEEVGRLAPNAPSRRSAKWIETRLLRLRFSNMTFTRNANNKQ